jgi:hypothetical protein
MIRTIATAAIAFGIAAFTLHRAALGALEEPLLLLAIGTVFLFAGRLFSIREQNAATAIEDEEAAELVPQRRRTA